MVLGFQGLAYIMLGPTGLGDEGSIEESDRCYSAMDLLRMDEEEGQFTSDEEVGDGDYLAEAPPLGLARACNG
jgi:hypothetical protein